MRIPENSKLLVAGLQGGYNIPLDYQIPPFQLGGCKDMMIVSTKYFIEHYDEIKEWAEAVELRNKREALLESVKKENA